jgi:hypothetical protein
MPADRSIHHVNLPARDLREAAPFHAAIVGMVEESFQRPRGAGAG